ncbi:MAG TPA: DUF4412 domain-containing protein [Bacteroidota bacterium]|nr:DUF4412 domain-containing protein [Bacteroidota bacterium]
MKIVSVIGLMMIACSAVFGQFEGVIDMKSTRGDGPDQKIVSTTLMLKGERIATTTAGMGRDGKEVKLIYAGDKNLIWMIDDSRKVYTEIALDSLPVPGTPDKEKKHSMPQKTGKSMTILGYACDEWVVEDSSMETHLWATQKLGGLYEGFTKAIGNLMNRGRGNAGLQGWQKEFMAMKAFPLKTERYKGGKLSDVQEITRIDEKTLAQSLFETPAGYTKQSLPTGMSKMIDQMRQQMIDRQKAGGKPDMEKIMKEMQDRMKNLPGQGKADSSGGNNH